MHRMLLCEYQLHLRRRNLAERSRELYGTVLRRYLADVDSLTATPGDVDLWLDSRRVAANGRASYITALAGFHAWLVTEEWRSDDPMQKVVRPRQPRKLPRPISTTDLRRALDAASCSRLTLWLCLAAFAGLRVHEIAALRIENVELAEDPRVADGVLVLRVTKGSRERVVPIARTLDTAFRAYRMPTSGPVFPALLGGHKVTPYPISFRTVSRTIADHLHGLGIPMTAHRLRDFFGTEVYRRTHDILLTSSMLGHADIRTTAGYTKLVPTDDAMRAIRDLDCE